MQLVTLSQVDIASIVNTSNRFTKEQMGLYGSAIAAARKEKRNMLASMSVAQVSNKVTAMLPDGAVCRDIRQNDSSKGTTWTVKYYKSHDNTKSALEAKLRREQAKVQAIQEQLSKLTAAKV
jgi:hypothetical protein